MVAQLFSIDLLKNGVQLTQEKVDSFKNENQFMASAVDLLIEITEILTFLASAHPLDEKFKPRQWSRNEAILAGLMMRISKMQVEILHSNKRKDLESFQIYFRCFSESVINLIFLSSKANPIFFDQFVAHSLKGEKELLVKIKKNILARNGKELPIETRMQRSILKCFEQSMMKPEDIQEDKKSDWTKLTLYQKAKEISLEDQYLSMFALPCHEVHGNWQDLIRYHLEFDNGSFTPSTNNRTTKPQGVIATTILSAYACINYLKLLSDCAERTTLDEIVKESIKKSKILDASHEKYVQNHGNIGS